MKKITWIVLISLAIASVGFIYKYFDQAFAIVNVKVTVDHNQIQAQAIQLAHDQGWDVDGYSSVVKFKHDGTVQSFVELEAGGKKAYFDMIEHDYYQPYTWLIRFYKQGVIKEFLATFKPDGSLYEFLIKVAERQEGPALSKDKALEIMQRNVGFWVHNFDAYSLVEYDSVTNPNGRVDHIAVYQRDDVVIGKGFYRLRLQVAGDQFVGCEHFVKIPDEFSRRYEEMFSWNTFLESSALNMGIVVYLFIIGFLLAIFFLQDRRYLMLRYCAYIVAFLGVLVIASMFNNIASVWFLYQTHTPAWVFFIQVLAMRFIKIISFLMIVLLVTIFATAADRYAFKNHIQFFKLWSGNVAPSWSIFEQTMFGYLLAIIMLGYQVAFALLSKSWGWWSPMDMLIDPNVLSSYIPCLSPLVNSFRAGFFEEMISRVLPLAGVAFLTRNHKHRRAIFMVAIVVQAIIFGALHANYPQQPCYNRVVEIFIPSIIFGLLYYWYGFLAGFVMHFSYDAVLFSIPIFISDLILHKIVCVVGILIPLGIVVWYWWRNAKKFATLSPQVYNRAVEFQLNAHSTQLEPYKLSQHILSSFALKVFFGLGLLGIIGIYLSKTWQFAPARVLVTKQQAEDIADQVAEELLYSYDDATWTKVTTFDQGSNFLGNSFIWQQYGKQAYAQLQNSYVMPPHWVVVWKKFKGSVQDRSEKFICKVGCQGQILGILHEVSQSKQGADLDEHRAVDIALQAIHEWYDLDKKDVKIVAVQSQKHADRRDWSVIFQDIINYSFDCGQARVVVKLAGDQLMEVSRYIHVPQEWEKQHERIDNQQDFINTIFSVLLLFMILFAFAVCYRRLGLSLPLLKISLISAAFFVISKIICWLNAWPTFLQGCLTSQPLVHQISSSLFSYTIMSAMTGFGLIMVIMYTLYSGYTLVSKKTRLYQFGLIFLGLCVGSLKFFLTSLIDGSHCMYPTFGQIDAVIPIVSIVLGELLLPTISFLVAAIVVVILAQIASKQYGAWLSVIIFVGWSMVRSGSIDLLSLPIWFGVTILMGVVWYLIYEMILQYDIKALLLLVFGACCAQVVPSIWYFSYPGIGFEYGVSLMIFAALITFLYKKF